MKNNNDLNRHKKSDKIKWIAVSIAVILLAVMLTATITSGFKNWNPYGWLDKEEEHQTEQPNEPDISTNGGVVDSSGNEMVSGKVYPMSSSMVFTSASSASTTSNSGITLQATVTPDSATNKTVDWYVSWLKDSSDWGGSKVVTDYVTVTPTSDGALTADVVCLQAFGQQIEISVISRDNPDAVAFCFVDYGMKIESVSLKFGNLPINLGGTTNVTCELNPNGVGIGGATNLDLLCGDIFTLADEFVCNVKIDTIINDEDYGSKLFALGGHHLAINTYYGANGSADITDIGYYFDYAHEIKNWWYDTRGGGKFFKDMSTSTLINDYFSDITQPEMFDITVTITGKHSTYTAVSRIVCTGYTNQASVTGVSVNNSTLVM